MFVPDMPYEEPPAYPEVIGLVAIVMFLIALFQNEIIQEAELRQFLIDIFNNQ